MTTIRSWLQLPLVKRGFACFAASIVLAVMIGPQEGTQEDYGYAFRQSVFKPRIFLFLGIGVLIFLLVTYWPTVKPYLTYPGAVALSSGLVAVIAGYQLLKWDDAVGDGKLGTVGPKVTETHQLSAIARTFFGWGHWTFFLIVAVLAAAAVVRHSNPLAWTSAVLALITGVWAFVAHHQVISYTRAVDHSLGAFCSLLGYLAVAVAAAAMALDRQNGASFRQSIDRALAWRQGLPMASAGLILALLAYFNNAWFSPQRLNLGFRKTGTILAATHGPGPTALTNAYFSWIGYTLLVVVGLLALMATYQRNAGLGWVTVVIGLLATLLTLITLYDYSKVGGKHGVDAPSAGPWQNLGAGGWLACMGFSLMAAGAFTAANALRTTTAPAAVSSDTVGRPGLSLRRTSGSGKSLLLIGLTLAVFLPPTMTTFWQKVLVSEIGVYVLLAIGLNVVVGWAGLLDLGFIAFYALGSYTTAYLVGSLPHKPPAWLHMSPLLAIPFAIAVCLVAGIALGAPTLRLRGDYLAIVTLGFGEIIRITAINNPGNITNSTRGPSPPSPTRPSTSGHCTGSGG